MDVNLFPIEAWKSASWEALEVKGKAFNVLRCLSLKLFPTLPQHTVKVKSEQCVGWLVVHFGRSGCRLQMQVQYISCPNQVKLFPMTKTATSYNMNFIIDLSYSADSSCIFVLRRLWRQLGTSIRSFTACIVNTERWFQCPFQCLLEVFDTPVFWNSMAYPWVTLFLKFNYVIVLLMLPIIDHYDIISYVFINTTFSRYFL